MIHHMDEGIGRVLRRSRKPARDENTLVVFTSDNGGERFSDNWPLVGKKMDLLEGGIRVPYIVRWPARVAAGGSTAQLAITMDWMATFLAAAGVAPHPDYPLDGISLLRCSPSRRDFERELYWRMKYRNQKAVRAGAGSTCRSRATSSCSTWRAMRASAPTCAPRARALAGAARALRRLGRRPCRRSRPTPGSFVTSKATLAQPS